MTLDVNLRREMPKFEEAKSKRESITETLYDATPAAACTMTGWPISFEKMLTSHTKLYDRETGGSTASKVRRITLIKHNPADMNRDLLN